MAYLAKKHPLLDICVNRRFLGLNSLLLASIFLALFFPVSGAAEQFIRAFAVYFALPALFIRFILREPLSNYGCSWGKRGIVANIIWILAGASLFGAFVWGVLRCTSSGQVFLSSSQSSLTMLHWDFLMFLGSMAFLAWFIFLKEVFFRGFFLLLWKKFLSWRSLVAHFLLVATVSAQELHVFAHADAFVTLLFTLVWSMVASIIAFATESVFVSFCFSLFSAILVLVLAISLS